MPTGLALTALSLFTAYDTSMGAIGFERRLGYRFVAELLLEGLEATAVSASTTFSSRRAE